MAVATQEQIGADAEVILNRLERVVRWSDSFTLAFVKCNSPVQRQAMSNALRERLSDKHLLEIELDKPIISLLDEITARWDTTNPPDAVCVYGLEKSINEQRATAQVLGRLNHDRDLLRRTVPGALLIWLPDFALDCLAQGAPDFWAWRSGVYEFPTDKELWQMDSIAAITPDAPALFSLTLEDKQKEIARLEELLWTAQALPRQGKREREIAANLLHQLGLLYESLGEWDAAQVRFEQSLKMAQELDHKRGIAHTWGQLGSIQFRQGKLAEAQQAYESALKMSEELSDKRGIASTLHNLAVVQQNQGNLQGAARLYKQSLQIKQELGDKTGITRDLHNLAMIMEDQGNLKEARRLFEQSLQMKRQLGDKSGITITLHEMGNLEYNQGNLEEAGQLYEQSLQIAQELGDKQGITYTLGQLGKVQQSQGNLAKAQQSFEQSLQMSEEMGDKSGIAITLHNLGWLQQEQNRPREAVQNYVTAWTLFHELRSPYVQLAQEDIEHIREQVGEEQFQEWMMNDFEKQANEIIEALNEERVLANVS